MLYPNGEFLQLTGADAYGCHSVAVGSFNGVKFARAAPKLMNLQEAVEFAANPANHGEILPSLQEESLLRVGQSVTAKEPSITRTVALYFMEGGLPWVSFDDYPAFNENIACAYAGRMCRQQMRSTEFYLSKTDVLVSAALKRAGESKRAMWDLSPNGRFEFDLSRDAERTRFAESATAKALYGGVASEVAAGIYQRRRSPHVSHKMVVQLLGANELRMGSDVVDVRLVYLSDIFGPQVEVNATGRSRMKGVATPIENPRMFYK